MNMDWPSEGMTKSKFESLSPLRSQKLISKLVFKHEQSLLTCLKIGHFAIPFIYPEVFFVNLALMKEFCSFRH